MQTSDNAPDNGNVLTTGGWLIAALAGALVYWVLHYKLGYYLLSSVVFGAAIGLTVLLVLLIAVSRSEPIIAPSRVRKIVPVPERAFQAEPVKAAAPAPSVSVAAPMVEPPVKTAPAAQVAAPVVVAEGATPAKPKAKAAAKPKAAPKPDAKAPTTGPVRLKAARKGGADDLKEIEGIGPALEKLMNSLGIYHFDQIAGWTDADVAILDAEMKGFKGRITRDKWVAQARIIVDQGLEAFRERAKTNGY